MLTLPSNSGHILPSMPAPWQKGDAHDEQAAAAAGARSHTAAAFPSTAKADAPFVLTSPLIAQAVNKSLAEVQLPSPARFH